MRRLLFAFMVIVAAVSTLVVVNMVIEDRARDPEIYLARAIDIIRKDHINSARADWPKIIARAEADIRGAQTPADTYPAISRILETLGEKHSLLVPASAVPPEAPAGSQIPEVEMPSARLLAGPIAMVRVPALDTMISPKGELVAPSYAAAIRTALQNMDKAPLCGWIVDLRGNSGGNMWPMLQGLDPLLGPGDFGAFVFPRGRIQAWRRTIGSEGPGSSPSAGPAFALEHAALPVALLVDGETASAGEMVAVAFFGRADVRSFGSPTAGFTTANKPVELPDGAMLMLTQSTIRDRTGTNYSGPLVPDVPGDAASAQAAAIAWIEGRCDA